MTSFKAIGCMRPGSVALARMRVGRFSSLSGWAQRCVFGSGVPMALFFGGAGAHGASLIFFGLAR